MKTKTYLLLLLVSALGFACSSKADLPEAANSFLSQYYPDVKTNRIEKDTDHGQTEYEAYLANGHEVTFDADGNWIDVDAPAGQTIPAGIAPAPIADYVTTNYPDLGINEISREHYGFDVELTNGLDLIFDPAGTFLRLDH